MDEGWHVSLSTDLTIVKQNKSMQHISCLYERMFINKTNFIDHPLGTLLAIGQQVLGQWSWFL